MKYIGFLIQNLKKKSLSKEYKEIISFLETRVDLDLMGWDFDIYAH